MSGSEPAAREAEAKRRYLASGRPNAGARTGHRPDIDAFLPAAPVATFTAAGKLWAVPHARNLKGMRRFLHVVKLLEPDPERPNIDRLFELLGVLVGGTWNGDQWVSDLPASVADALTFNEVDDLVQLAVAGDGRPPKGEGPPTPVPSAGSSPSTAASIPETATGT